MKRELKKNEYQTSSFGLSGSLNPCFQLFNYSVFFCAFSCGKPVKSVSLGQLSAPLEHQLDEPNPIPDQTPPSSGLYRYYTQPLHTGSSGRNIWRVGGVCRRWGWMEADDWLWPTPEGSSVKEKKRWAKLSSWDVISKIENFSNSLCGKLSSHSGICVGNRGRKSSFSSAPFKWNHVQTCSYSVPPWSWNIAGDWLPLLTTLCFQSQKLFCV